MQEPQPHIRRTERRARILQEKAEVINQEFQGATPTYLRGYCSQFWAKVVGQVIAQSPEELDGALGSREMVRCPKFQVVLQSSARQIGGSDHGQCLRFCQQKHQLGVKRAVAVGSIDHAVAM